ncbi:polysaccharide deacetylase family protein [Patulibacter defluvii]|uniref:polysaccharide deacetylase family protein n=1 Tax=Patulibacter defluvii TaxID=3095358 RepID=UPI002A75B69E|nr:polysaccharide deacetylase [Patulibacter sp. DM4]
MSDPAPDRPHGPPREPAPADWGGGAAATVLLCFDVDAEAPILAEGAHHAHDLSAMSHQAYGPLVGIPRILAMLDRHQVPGTFFVPGATAERWPSAVRAIVDAGHEVALHGHTHATLPGVAADEQRADFERALAALRALGIEPRGYRAPFWRQTAETLALVAEHGLAYDSSLMDDDRPYRLRVGERAIAELPVHWSLDDWEQYAFLPEPDVGQRIVAPSRALEIWLEELDAMRATGSLCALTAHPFLSGRPSRIRALERFVIAAREHGDVAFARADALAERVLADA